MNTSKSEQLWKKGQKLEINGTSLFSRGPRISVDGFAPKYCDRADGCYFWDVDGNKFLDYGMAVGSIILGHGFINDAIKNQLSKGTNLTLLSPLEVELAEEIRKNIPSCQRLKFLSSGTEATEAAIRIARAYTERDIVIHDHYHGWSDWCVPSKSGVPKDCSSLSIKEDTEDIERYRALFDMHSGNIACIIVEPVKSEDVTYAKRKKFLRELKELCEDNHSLLIFDEVACGYRFGVGGAQSFFKVTPDISTFGKAIANGLPFSFVGCSEEIGNEVEDKVFISSTFGGNVLSLAACRATTSIMKASKVEKYLAYYGEKLKSEINKISEENFLQNSLQIVGFPQRIAWKQTNWDLVSLMFQEFIRNDIFFAWEIKNSYSHVEGELNQTIETFSEVVKICKKAKEENKILEHLEGKPMRPIL